MTVADLIICATRIAVLCSLVHFANIAGFKFVGRHWESQSMLQGDRASTEKSDILRAIWNGAHELFLVYPTCDKPRRYLPNEVALPLEESLKGNISSKST
jgi:hypothetical protein